MRTTKLTPNTIVCFRANFKGDRQEDWTHDFLGSTKLSDIADSDNFYWMNDKLFACYDGSETGFTSVAALTNIGRIDDVKNKCRYYTLPLSEVKKNSKEWRAIWKDDSTEGEDAQIVLDERLALESLMELSEYYNGRHGVYDARIFYKIVTRERYTISDQGDIIDRAGNVLTLVFNNNATMSTDKPYVAKVL